MARALTPLLPQCFYHLEEYDDALRLALGAGQYFDINSKSQYTDTIIGKLFLCHEGPGMAD